MSQVYKKYFKDKKITLMGLGLLGRGVGDALFLAECGADLIVTDMKTSKELAESLEKLSHYKNITYVLGEHRLEDFENRDIVIKAAGVSLESLFIEHARLHSTQVIMDEALFVETAQKMNLDLTIIGVTGTRGKTTTSFMVRDILKKSKKKAHLAGNIRGTATLPLLTKVKKHDIVVLELSSWQMQGFGEISTSPHISVFTNFYDDHMNYYRGMRNRYYFDKSIIYRYQNTEDFLVIGEQVKDMVESDLHEIYSTVITARPTDLDNDLKLQTPGDHMRANAACALAVARILGIDDKISKKALESFKGVEGRLQFLTNIKGVEIYNDSNATNPEAAIAALETLGNVTRDHKSVVLISGGADKDFALEKLVKSIGQYAKYLALIEGNGTERLVKELEKKEIDFEIFESLEVALENAMKNATEGDTLLFSPVFASFNHYNNEYERNDEFLNLIKKYDK